MSDLRYVVTYLTDATYFLFLIAIVTSRRGLVGVNFTFRVIFFLHSQKVNKFRDGLQILNLKGLNSGAPPCLTVILDKVSNHFAKLQLCVFLNKIYNIFNIMNCVLGMTTTLRLDYCAPKLLLIIDYEMVFFTERLWLSARVTCWVRNRSL